MSAPHIQLKKTFGGQVPTWCPGCGDFGIWKALQRTLVNLGRRPDEIALVFGIGCAGNMSNFIKGYGFHGLHGRALPVAEGISLANHELPVVVIGGDGDGLGEGVGHFVHTARSNPNLTYILHDNQVYGLTKGQHSPTAARGTVSPTAPDGVIEEPLNPVALALSLGASFVARGFAGDVDGLEKILTAAIQHDGFSFVDVLQPCVTYNHHNTYRWYYERVYRLAENGHDPNSFDEAWARSHEAFEEKIGTGIFYQARRPSLWSQQPALKPGPLVGSQPSSPVNVSDLLELYH